MQIRNGFKGFLVLLLLFIFGCQNTEVPQEKDNSKEELEVEYTAEMSKNGNEEISIDDIEKDMKQNDEKLENIMQEMEEEMEVDE